MDYVKISDVKYFIKSDSGNTYTVRLIGDTRSTITCSCKSYIMRKRCKHSDFIKDLVSSTTSKTLRVQAKPKDPFDYREPYEKQIKDLIVKTGLLK